LDGGLGNYGKKEELDKEELKRKGEEGRERKEKEMEEKKEKGTRILVDL